MNKNRYHYLVCLLMIAANKVFAQQPIDTLTLKTGKDEGAFIEKVQLITVKKQRPALLKDGSYKIENSTQKADIVLSGKLISGTVTEHREDGSRTDFVIANSYVSSLKTYTGNTLSVDVYREKTGLLFKEYYPGGSLKTEGSMSLDKSKHYGRGITRWYDEDGSLQKIANSITETYTDFYPGGKKKSVSAPNLQESYNESGNLTERQYRKNNVRYVEQYYQGKLYTRSYETSDNGEATEYYTNGILDKKEVIKTINGERRRLIYNKAGKLTGNEAYQAAAPVE